MGGSQHGPAAASWPSSSQDILPIVVISCHHRKGIGRGIAQKGRAVAATAAVLAFTAAVAAPTAAVVGTGLAAAPTGVTAVRSLQAVVAHPAHASSVARCVLMRVTSVEKPLQQNKFALSFLLL